LPKTGFSCSALEVLAKEFFSQQNTALANAVEAPQISGQNGPYSFPTVK
jgi:hypothetical protein